MERLLGALLIAALSYFLAILSSRAAFEMGKTRSSAHFEVQQRLESDYSPHSFTEYVSSRTGMRAVVVDQPGPKIQGYFTVATEIHDDSGSPHTLEHLCFMGSKNFPFKGLLDKVATRAYSMTNAWTATDHTAYTLDTGGYAAFAQMLPVYLEHVLLPTLTDAACYTEVHHIDGTGHDAGVVYSEMQNHQNEQAELIELRAKRLMYPEGIGFRYETGGMMERLRVLTAERIREFHRDLYQPKNLCVLVVGEVDHDHFLSVLEKFESDVVLPNIPPHPEFKRPWLDSAQPPKLKESIVETVEFPDEDESMGEVSIRYFGPDCDDALQSRFMACLHITANQTCSNCHGDSFGLSSWLVGICVGEHTRGEGAIGERCILPADPEAK